MKTTVENDWVTDLFGDHRPPDPSYGGLRDRLQAQFHEWTRRPGVTTPVDEQALAERFVETAITELPGSVERYTQFLGDVLLPHSINLGSPRCLAHMTTNPPTFVPLLAELCAGLNQNLVKRDASRVMSLMERQVLATMHRLAYGRAAGFYRRQVQARNTTLGIMTSCGTIANATALWCARSRLFPLTSAAPNVEHDGLKAVLDHYGCERAVILASNLAHYSIEKAAGRLGLGARNLLRVPVDACQRLDLRALRRLVTRCRQRRWRIVAVVAVAGTTDCGSIDPLGAVAEIAAGEGVHYHVDAAWGGGLLLSAAHRDKLEGIERADSITVDAHKQLHLPTGLSLVLLRDPATARAMEIEANYMLRDNSGDLGRVSMEGSRPGMALFLHAALEIFGRSGYARLVDGSLERTGQFAQMIRESAAFELLAEPQTNMVVYRYLPPALRHRRLAGPFGRGANAALNRLTEQLQQDQYQAGNALVSRTTLTSLADYRGQPIVCLRAVISNPLTGEDDLRCVLEDQLRLGAQLESQRGARRYATVLPATGDVRRVARAATRPGCGDATRRGGNGKLHVDGPAFSPTL